MDSSIFDKTYEHLGIVVFGNQVCISVGKDIIRLLGNPAYICIRINSNYNSVLFKPCEEHDPMSFKVPAKLLIDHRCTFKIHSKMFVQCLLLANNLDLTEIFQEQKPVTLPQDYMNSDMSEFQFSFNGL